MSASEQLRSLCELSRRVIELELRRGCRDDSVFGGFAVFAARKLGELLSLDERPVVALHDEGKRLLDELRSYGSLDGPSRRDLLERISVFLKSCSVESGRSVRRMRRMEPDAPVQFLKGVGPAWARTLGKLGIRTVGDLLLHFPFRYEDRGKIVPLSEAAGVLQSSEERGSGVVVRGKVLEVSKAGRRRRWGSPSVVEARICDGEGEAVLVWFNQAYVAERLRRGMLLTAYVRDSGRRSRGLPRLVVQEYVTGEEGDEGVESAFTGLVPVYPSCGGITSRRLRMLIGRALECCSLPETLPSELRERYGYPDVAAALRWVHAPITLIEASKGRERFVFEEFLVLQLALALRRRMRRESRRGMVVGEARRFIEEGRGLLPFELTSSQVEALEAIASDLEAPWPMSRLLQGDVGAGKTVVAFLALYATVKSGFQGALMAPTEILAEQHHLKLKSYCEAAGIRCELLTGSTSRTRRRVVIDLLRRGDVGLLIGTHALIQEDVVFRRLGLVVIDEQHRFGVAQRASLWEKGRNPNVLVMTATPIPRTLTLTLYGDLDVSRMEERPPGRIPVRTSVVTSDRLADVYDHIRREVEAGHQAFVVCPLVEDSERSEAMAAVELFERLRGEVFPDLKVGLLHGRMPAEEKERVMSGMAAGEIQILVCTTVVEVGVDVPSATVIVVLDADRFGLAQLHQLRGRVGRSSLPSWCYLVSDRDSARLKVMESTDDGFRIAEEDLRIRGPGEVFGTRQSGMPRFRVADPVADVDVLVKAGRAAAELVDASPVGRRGEVEALFEAARRRYRQYVRGLG